MNAIRNIGIEARRITKKRDKRPRVWIWLFCNQKQRVVMWIYWEIC